MPLWLHVTACVLVPAGWGVLMYYAFNAIDRKRPARRADDPPPVDYSI